MSDEPVVLGVCIERLSMEPCVIVNCFDDIKEFKGHGELIGRGVSSKMPGLKAHHYLGWCTLPPGKVCSGHWHDCEEIWVIISGEATLIDCNGSERKIKKGDFIYVTPNGYHECRNTGKEPLDFIVIESPIPQLVIPYRHGFFEPIEKVTLKAKPIEDVVKGVSKSRKR